MTRTLVSAHAGGSEGQYQPDTLAAANAVRDSGVDLIEFDVRVTKDRKFVVLHDANVLIDDALVPVKQLTLAQVLANTSAVSTLHDMLLIIKDHAIAHVDIKDAQFEIEIADLCESILGRHGYVITTLNDSSVIKIRHQRPDVQVALTIGRDTRGLSRFQNFKIRLGERFPTRRIARCNPTMLAICYMEAWPSTLRWARKHHLPIILWTMDSEELMKESWDNPYIWAFSTNYPREALALSHQTKKIE